MKFQTLILLGIIAQTFGLPFEGKIIGGSNAYPGQFPHQVSLQSYGQHFCGGSIINPRVILTAAHCIHTPPSDLTVVAGITELSSSDQAQRVSVKSIIPHPEYDPTNLLNDVAILKLESNIQLGGDVQNVRLRSSDADVGELLQLSGWGLTSLEGPPPNDLQFVGLQAIDLDTCAYYMEQFHPIREGHVCTISPPGEGACMGDSGGPLIDSHNQQIGIVSWGYPCALGLPDVFTSVPHYLNWIISNS